jgi:hypothetical protein
VNRRSLLKGIAALPIAAAIDALALPRVVSSMPFSLVDANQLDVYFHGLFAFVFDDIRNTIRVYMPIVNIANHIHVYRGGTKVDFCADPKAKEKSLVQGEQYNLDLPGYVFTGPLDPAQFRDESVWISRKLSPVCPDIAKAFCTIDLPIPNSLMLHHRACRSDNFPIFVGNDAKKNNINIKHIAKTHIFRYGLNGKPFALRDNEGNAFWPTPGNATPPLHIFAEPEAGITPGHEGLALDAFDLLTSMLVCSGQPLSLFPIPFDSSTFINFDDSLCDEMSLGERTCSTKTMKCETVPKGACPSVDVRASDITTSETIKPHLDKQFVKGHSAKTSDRPPRSSGKVDSMDGTQGSPTAGGEVANCVGVYVYP